MCQNETTTATKFVRLTFANAREQILKSIGKTEGDQTEGEEPMEEQEEQEVGVTMVMSNDPLMGVRVFCAICDHNVALSGLKSHLRSHEVTLTQYTKVYGDPRREIVTKVHHACAVCTKVMLLNTFDISKHVRKHHLTFTEYAKKYMRRGEGLLQSSSSSSQKTSGIKASKSKRRVSFAETICSVKLYKPSESPEKVQNSVQYLTLDEDEDTSAVKIQCHICFKSFKMNKQLSAHMKRH